MDIPPLTFWPAEPFQGGGLASVQHSQTHIFILLYSSSRKTRVCKGEGIITLVLNTLREGGERGLFILVYLPRTAGLSSTMCLCNVAPMGAAVLGNTVWRQPMPSWGVCTPSRQESSAGRRKKNKNKSLLLLFHEFYTLN